MTQTIDLALLFEDSAITVGPRDGASRAWLLAGGDIHCDLPIAKIRREWQMRGVHRRDLPVIAAQLEYELNAQRFGYEQADRHWMGATREETHFRVRACEYRDVVISQQLVEIKP